MKKQINLYHASYFPKRQLATFKQFVILLSVSLAALALLNVVFNQQLSNIKKNMQVQQTEVKTKQQQLSSLLTRLQSQRAPQSKLQEQTLLEAEIIGKQRLLGSLAGVEFAVVVSFSDLMRGLSLANIDTLSIDQFSMQQGRLNISGKAKNSDSLPLWLTKIQATDELSQIAFEKLQIHDKENHFLFNLSNVKQPLALDRINSLQNFGDK